MSVGKKGKEPIDSYHFPRKQHDFYSLLNQNMIGTSNIPFKYDDGKLRRIDELRHEIIHSKYGIGNLLRVSDVEKKPNFLEQTGMYLVPIVKKRYFTDDVDLTTC
jgi:hypothetical protein